MNTRHLKMPSKTYSTSSRQEEGAFGSGIQVTGSVRMEVALNTVAQLSIHYQGSVQSDLRSPMGYGSKKSFYKIFLRFNKPE